LIFFICPDFFPSEAKYNVSADKKQIKKDENQCRITLHIYIYIHYAAE